MQFKSNIKFVGLIVVNSSYYLANHKQDCSDQGEALKVPTAF